MVALTRRQAAVAKSASLSPSASGSAKIEVRSTGSNSIRSALSPRGEDSAPLKGEVAENSSRNNGGGSTTKAQLLADVPTIPLFDFDLPLELDAPQGLKVSAFNPAPYIDLIAKLEKWFPHLTRQDDEQEQDWLKAPAKPSTDEDSPAKTGRRRGKATASVISNMQDKPIGSKDEVQGKQKRGKGVKRTGKAKRPDCIHLEVEFVPRFVTESDLCMPRDGPYWGGSQYAKPQQALAVVAFAPPGYRPDRTKVKSMVKTEADAEAQAEGDGHTDSDEDDVDTLLLGYIVPSAFKDKAHPLLHMDPTLLSKEWIQLYGEVTLVPPFLPPRNEVFGRNAFPPLSSRPVLAGIGSFATGLGSSAIGSKAESGLASLQDSNLLVAMRPRVPSTRLLGVLNVQVGLEPVALQYGAGDARADGFVASNDDLKDTGAEGSLSLAKALRQAIPAIVDWKHTFVEVDMHAHTYWDRNASFYDLPPKQSTLARHLVLDKTESVDLPSAPKTTSKKRKKASRPSRNSQRWPRDYSEDDMYDECACPNCRAHFIPDTPPTPEPPRPKVNALPLGEQVSGDDARLGDPASERFLPLDTNVASLLEACRPPLDGPKVYPPSGMILTPLLGYQARCLAWMIKKETILDEDVSELMPNWSPLRCKSADCIMQRRLQLEAEREALIDAMHHGLSRSRRNVKVKEAKAGAASANVAMRSEDDATMSDEPLAKLHSSVLKREPFTDPVDQSFYFDHVSGLLSLRRFPCRRSEPGGALCESMGLGKTLESLSLIAAHPRPNTEDLLSYDTSRSAKMISEMGTHERPFVSRATLVVCPAALVEQWMDEIRKHFRSRVTMDDTKPQDAGTGPEIMQDWANQQPGVLRFRHADFAWDVGSSRKDVRALARDKLTQPDIVVATYEELAFQLSESHRVSRSQNQVRTPLLEVLFWRILLDEAQIVAGASGKATEMIHELWRSNCWMVTGTPVTKGIRDIQGIFAFLDHDPFAAPRFFRDILQEPFTQGCIEGIRRLRSILPRFVWRHTQAHVEEEIFLPPCKSEVLEIELKHIERLFYDKEVNKYREMFAKRASQGTATVSQPTFLVNLRQLLSHPQIADQLLFSNNYSRLSFVELFRQFCRQAQQELDAIRMQLVTSTLQLVWGHDFHEAEEDKRRWRGGRRILQEPEDIRKLLNAALRVVNMALEDQSLARTASIGGVQDEDPDGGPSLAEGSNRSEGGGGGPETADPFPETPTSKSQSDVADQQGWVGTDSLTRVNLTWEEASYWLRTLLQKHAHAASPDACTDRIEPPTRWDPERPTRTFFDKEFKNANDKSVDLTDARFHLIVQDAGAEDMDEDELMAQIEAERQGSGSTSSTSKRRRKDATLEPGMLKKSRLRGNATQRKEARVWLYKARERLETTHAKLLMQQERLPSKQHEVAFLRQKLLELDTSGADVSPAEAAGESDAAVAAATAECLICFDSKEQIGVLPCYHSFCIDCIETLCKNSSSRPSMWYDSDKPRCPSCRLAFHPDRVTRVMERGRSASTEGESEVVGDWSGKISGLITDLKKRLRQDATHKAVIFSHWPKMLAFVREALVQNDIAAVVFGGNEAAQAEALRAIRDDNDVNVIMVPFRASAGAAGLTLTTCDLAYLMEPALDAALEAQAVGRIHRIGQRRETTVIRVKMKATIEEAVMRIADERSRKGMALATHADTSATAEFSAQGEAPTTCTAADASTSSTSGVAAGSSQVGASKLVRADPPSTSSLRERSIKSSVAASVGAARESDTTSLTMTEVGLILGFDVDEEKRKARERRESMMARAYDYGLTPALVNRLTEEALDDIEQDFAMFEEEEVEEERTMEDIMDGYDDDDGEMDWPLSGFPTRPDGSIDQAADAAADSIATAGQSTNQVQFVVEVQQTDEEQPRLTSSTA
ncbi:related to SNF2 family helicase/ATPase [Melanopsichium pennsylvanicum]|uniref:Related to SNF2 family helicase/ATPase n=2 Tax=Melanopsichium pennsylvanicum TaxID=63383 RepID=A0AAJ4XG77_9BASI|nr:related to SNF2 family helicase/ATPase [Melanopsichium pennsylvanicum 4]SNX81757.1 related to SNF2 family helicase/ATPase [Melanopsichium pennsylvanicum]